MLKKIQEQPGTADEEYYTDNEFAYDALAGSESPTKITTPNKVMIASHFL